MRIVPDGIYYAGGLAIAGCVFAYLWQPWMALPCFVLAIFCLYFFRDPERSTPQGNFMVSPADGRVVSVKQITPNQTRISIFLNIFNVHVNRTPVPGTITDVQYRKGKFLVASHEAASLENEQNTLRIATALGEVTCRQIAGLIARRIVCYRRTGEQVGPGERIGYIKFGSRVDVLFGPEWKATVQLGDKVTAGLTVIAKPAEGVNS